MLKFTVRQQQQPAAAVPAPRKERKSVRFSEEVVVHGSSGRPARPALPTAVGLSSLPAQLLRRTSRHTFSFHLVVLGEKGIGKSSVLRSIFPATSGTAGAAGWVEHTFLLHNAAVRLQLAVSEAPGYCEVDNTELFTQIQARLAQQLELRCKASISSATTQIKRN